MLVQLSLPSLPSSSASCLADGCRERWGLGQQGRQRERHRRQTLLSPVWHDDRKVMEMIVLLIHGLDPFQDAAAVRVRIRTSTLLSCTSAFSRQQREREKISLSSLAICVCIVVFQGLTHTQEKKQQTASVSRTR